jgi:hypothetical protein
MQWNIMDIPTSFIWIIIFSDRALEYDKSVKFLGYVGTNTEPLCVEFCNFVQCHTYVNYLTCYYYTSYNSFQLAW